MTRLRVIAASALLLLAVAALARIGGGQTYSGGGRSSSSSGSSSGSSSRSSSSPSYHPSSGGGGGSSGYSSGGGSGGGDLNCGCVALLLFVVVFFVIVAAIAKERQPNVTVTAEPPPDKPAADLSQLRRFDPNFSEIVFADFCYSLFARVYEARGRGRLADYAPYVSADVRAGIVRYAPAGLTSIDEIVIGSFNVADVRGLDRPQVEVDLEFEANYTETAAGTVRRWYVSERWTLTRARDILSPIPEKARAEHCPKCGAPLQTRSDGACQYCGTVVADGSFNWFVRAIKSLAKSERPRELGGGSGGEAGTQLPTVSHPQLGRQRQKLVEQHPEFRWEDFEQRVREVAQELQAAWTSRDWHRARRFETEALFQMHRYWIDEYVRQGLRNVVDGFTIQRVDVVKVASDAFYDAITVRLFAAGADYTVNDSGGAVSGSKYPRQWSEYWTFVRGRAGASADARVCPNCGGARDDGQSAICAYCGGKIIAGEFPWVLSRIEQDEAYRG
jgi:ribosomal protein L37AE/L43A